MSEEPKTLKEQLEEIAWTHGIVRDNINGRPIAVPRCDRYPYQTFEKTLWLNDVKEIVEGLVAEIMQTLDDMCKKCLKKCVVNVHTYHDSNEGVCDSYSKLKELLARLGEKKEKQKP